MRHLYPLALRFDKFFHGTFKTPQVTNGNLIIAVLLVESNTMAIGHCVNVISRKKFVK